jgi:hypothetical protein
MAAAWRRPRRGRVSGLANSPAANGGHVPSGVENDRR